MEFVSWDDDIPNIDGKVIKAYKSHVANHQSEFILRENPWGIAISNGGLHRVQYPRGIQSPVINASMT
jgi:hypothetical protein